MGRPVSGKGKREYAKAGGSRGSNLPKHRSLKKGSSRTTYSRRANIESRQKVKRSRSSLKPSYKDYEY